MTNSMEGSGEGDLTVRFKNGNPYIYKQKAQNINLPKNGQHH